MSPCHPPKQRKTLLRQHRLPWLVLQTPLLRECCAYSIIPMTEEARTKSFTSSIMYCDPWIWESEWLGVEQQGSLKQALCVRHGIKNSFWKFYYIDPVLIYYFFLGAKILVMLIFWKPQVFRCQEMSGYPPSNWKCIFNIVIIVFVLEGRVVLNYEVLVLLISSAKDSHMSMHNAHMQVSPSLHLVIWQ